MDAFHAILEQHAKIKLPYPRPTITCSQCKSDLIPCVGKKIKPYLRHKHKSDHEPVAESWEHKRAKNLIVEYLNGGGKCLFKHACQEGEILVESVIGFRYHEEVKFLDSILDVAAVDGLGQVVFNIEIKHTHLTTNIKDRRTMPWVEVIADQVITELERPERNQVVSFKNIASCSLCSSSRIIIPRTIDNQNLPITPIPPVQPLTVHVSSLPKPGECFNEDEMPYRLGYIKNRLVCEVTVAAMKGIFKYVNGGDFLLRSYLNCRCYLTGTCDYCEAWDEFLSYRLCLCCMGKHSDVSYGRPYCIKCYKRIQHENLSFDKHIGKFDKMKLKTYLRNAMSWISSVSGGAESDSRCDYCYNVLSNVAETYKAEPYVWWFGDKKRLCWDCLDAKLSSDGVYTEYIKVIEDEEIVASNPQQTISSDDILMKAFNDCKKLWHLPESK